MPHCAVCDTRIYGSSNYCTLHRPRLRRSHAQDYCNYSSDSTYPGDTNFRTSAGTVARRRQRNNSSSALALHNPIYIDTSTASTPLVSTLAQSFAGLQNTRVIASWSYSVSHTGAHTLQVDANLDCEQCPVCCAWFANHGKLKLYQWERPVACEMHRLSVYAQGGSGVACD